MWCGATASRAAISDVSLADLVGVELAQQFGGNLVADSHQEHGGLSRAGNGFSDLGHDGLVLASAGPTFLEPHTQHVDGQFRLAFGDRADALGQFAVIFGRGRSRQRGGGDLPRLPG